MNKLSSAEFAGRTLIVLALAALFALLWAISTIFVLIFAGLILALVLRSAMQLVVRFTPLRGRWALLAGILGLLVLVGLVGLLIGARVATQANQLTQTLPRAWQRAQASIGATAGGRGLLHALQSQAGAGRWFEQLTALVTVTFGALVDALVILFTGLYFAIDPRLYKRGLLHLVPAARRAPLDQAIDQATHALGRWLKGVLLSMLSIGVVTGCGLWLLGVPLALALGILAGLCEFIPYLGPFISGVPAVLVAFTAGPSHALEVLILYFAVHLFEGELLVPLIQKWAVALPPALGIVAVVVFGWLFGVLGVVFATPLTVVLMTLVQSLYVRRVADE